MFVSKQGQPLASNPRPGAKVDNCGANVAKEAINLHSCMGNLWHQSERKGPWDESQNRSRE